MPGRFDRDKYVSVQERINRFRTEHPGGAIVTTLMSLPDDATFCRYKAEVYRDLGDQRPASAGFATEVAGASKEDGANFGNHEENCETSAIGRALANFGYATSKDDRPSAEEIDKVNRIADAPVERGHVGDSPIEFASTRGRRVSDPSPPSDGQAVTGRQITFIHAIAREAGLDEAALREDVQASFGCALEDLGKREASEYIERLQALHGQDAPVMHQKPPEPPKSTRSGNVIPKDEQAALVGVSNSEADWITKINDATTAKQIDGVRVELTNANVISAPVWEAFGKKRQAINSTR
jgi:hypothetical protein